MPTGWTAGRLSGIRRLAVARVAVRRTWPRLGRDGRHDAHRLDGGQAAGDSALGRRPGRRPAHMAPPWPGRQARCPPAGRRAGCRGFGAWPSPWSPSGAHGPALAGMAGTMPAAWMWVKLSGIRGLAVAVVSVQAGSCSIKNSVLCSRPLWLSSISSRQVN
jgi:hypothetical protein